MKDKNVLEPKQINIANGNSILNAVQVVNNIEQKKIPKMMTPDPIPYSHYISQNNENLILERLKKVKRVFLQGIGGIGKTTLAKRIYELSKNMYEHLGWIEFKENWKTSLVEGLFTSCFQFEENISLDAKYNKIVEFLTNLGEQEKNTLIVIDNFNVSEEGTLNEILRLPITILITTRCNFSTLQFGYKLESLDEFHGKQLFLQNYTTPEMLTFSDNRYIEEIVKESHGYPLAIELIAKAISYRNIEIAKFLEKLRLKEYRIESFDLSADSDWNNLNNEKIVEQLSKVYQLSELSLEEKQIIKIISILPANSVISNKDLQKYVPFDCRNAQNCLTYRGWITQYQNGFSMHEVVCDSVYKYNSISYDECELLLFELEKATNISRDTNVIHVLKYAKYAYNVIHIMRENLEFCRHLFLKEAALIFKETGNYGQAKEMLDIFIKAYDETRMEDKIILAEAYNNYSKIFSIEGDIDNALEKALYAEKLIDEIPACSDKDYFLKKMVIKKTVAMDYAHYKQYQKALDKMKEAIENVEFISLESKYQVTNLYSDYARLLLDIGDITGSIKNYKKVLNDYDEQGIENSSPWRYTTYTYLSNAFILEKDIISANNYAFQALIGKYSIYSENNYALANALLSMAKIYQFEKQLWDVAAVFYKKAIDIFKKNGISDNYCRCLAGLSIVEQNIGLAMRAYNILESSNVKYDIYTYIDIINALILEKPQEALKLGEEILTMYWEYEEKSVIQYVYALMGKACYLLDDVNKAETYLKKINIFCAEGSRYFEQEIKDIEKSISLRKIYLKERRIAMDRENGVSIVINGGQINVSKDESILYATLNTDSSSRALEIEEIVGKIMMNVSCLEEQTAEQIIDIVNMAKQELLKPVPQSSRLRNCLTLIGPMITIVNGVPILAENLNKLKELILSLVK